MHLNRQKQTWIFIAREKHSCWVFFRHHSLEFFCLNEKWLYCVYTRKVALCNFFFFPSMQLGLQQQQQQLSFVPIGLRPWEPKAKTNPACHNQRKRRSFPFLSLFLSLSRFSLILAIKRVFFPLKLPFMNTTTTMQYRGKKRNSLISPIHFFSERMGENETSEVGCQAWTNKQPKAVQPDLNYVGEWNVLHSCVLVLNTVCKNVFNLQLPNQH